MEIEDSLHRIKGIFIPTLILKPPYVILECIGKIGSQHLIFKITVRNKMMDSNALLFDVFLLFVSNDP